MHRFERCGVPIDAVCGRSACRLCCRCHRFLEDSRCFDTHARPWVRRSPIVRHFRETLLRDTLARHSLQSDDAGLRLAVGLTPRTCSEPASRGPIGPKFRRRRARYEARGRCTDAQFGRRANAPHRPPVRDKNSRTSTSTSTRTSTRTAPVTRTRTRRPPPVPRPSGCRATRYPAGVSARRSACSPGDSTRPTATHAYGSSRPTASPRATAPD
jgi:hypothetical protein